jgi:hypothetical protein
MPPKKNNKQSQQQADAASAASADGEIVMGEAPPTEEETLKPRSVVARDPRREMALIREDQQRNARYLAISVMLCKIQEEMEDEELRIHTPS